MIDVTRWHMENLASRAVLYTFEWKYRKLYQRENVTSPAMFRATPLVLVAGVLAVGVTSSRKFLPLR